MMAASSPRPCGPRNLAVSRPVPRFRHKTSRLTTLVVNVARTLCRRVIPPSSSVSMAQAPSLRLWWRRHSRRRHQRAGARRRRGRGAAVPAVARRWHWRIPSRTAAWPNRSALRRQSAGLIRWPVASNRSMASSSDSTVCSSNSTPVGWGSRGRAHFRGAALGRHHRDPEACASTRRCRNLPRRRRGKPGTLDMGAYDVSRYDSP